MTKLGEGIRDPYDVTKGFPELCVFTRKRNKSFLNAGSSLWLRMFYDVVLLSCERLLRLNDSNRLTDHWTGLWKDNIIHRRNSTCCFIPEMKPWVRRWIHYSSIFPTTHFSYLNPSAYTRSVPCIISVSFPLWDFIFIALSHSP